MIDYDYWPAWAGEMTHHAHGFIIHSPLIGYLVHNHHIYYYDVVSQLGLVTEFNEFVADKDFPKSLVAMHVITFSIYIWESAKNR